MVDISIGRNDIIITLDRREKFLALKRKISIPKENIVSVSTEVVKPAWIAPKIGTHVPKGFMAGTFWRGKGKSFYYVRDFAKCITIHLKGHEYSKVILETDDKVEAAERIRAILK